MKSFWFLTVLMLSHIGFSANRYWVASSASNWNNTANWSATNGGAGGASVPTAGDFVYFNSNGLGDCSLDINADFDGFNSSGYTGVIDLNGFLMNPTVSGTDYCVFNGGTITDNTNTITLAFATSNYVRFNGMTIDVPLNFTTDRIDFDGSVFNEGVEVLTNGVNGINGAGGNTFNSTLKITNTGSGYVLLGYTNPDIFNDDVTLINTGTSRIRLAYNSPGNQFNGNIIVACTNGGGIYLGEGALTSSTMASTKSISIDATGFSVGTLQLKSFQQIGATPQNFSLSGTARLFFNESEFDGAIDVDAPQIIVNGSTFNSTADIEKTGASNNASTGLNTFVGNCTLSNSGSGYFTMGNTNPDMFNSNLTVNNTGTSNVIIGHSSSGNTIAGNLDLNNSGNIIYVSYNQGADVTVNGLTTGINTSSLSTSNIILGRRGHLFLNSDVNLSNNSTGTNGYLQVASDSAANVIINGNTTVTNTGSGNNKTVYLGVNGDVTFNGTLSISNSATASNSRVYCNHNTYSYNYYNDDIFVESTVAGSDGVFFGNNQGGGELAGTKVISILGGGFVDGYLYFRNFTQLGNTAQNLSCTGTTIFYNYDSNWGGDVNFSSPRLYTRGTVYNGLATLEKNGSTNDMSYGANVFHDDTEIICSGDGYIGTGNNVADSCLANLTLTNTGQYNIYFANNSVGNYVAQNLTISNTGSGANNSTLVGNSATATIDILGNIDATNTSSANSSNIRIGNNGVLTCQGNANLINTPSGTAGNIYFGNNAVVTLNGDCTVNNGGSSDRSYVYMAYGTTSTVDINGVTTVTNSTGNTTKQIYLGYNGAMTFDGDITMTNSSSATNSAIHLNYGASSSNLYNENIVCEATDANSDGILFGRAGGAGVLAANKLVSIGGAGFIAGDLYFRNFTQVGPTNQNLVCSGTARIYNYDSDWGGDVDFQAPRMITQGTLYNGLVYLEKTGANNDMSSGGNTFTNNTELRNTGSGYFGLGNGNPDDFQNDLLINNLGTHSVYIAYNSIGNQIAGNLDVNNQGISGGSSTIVYFCSNASSTLTINGTADLLEASSALNSRIFFPDGGTINLNNDLNVLSNSTSTDARVYLANGTSSALNITGITTINNQGASTTKIIYVGNNGDVTFDGDLSLSNTSTATNSSIHCNYRASSSNNYNQNITVESTNAGCDGIYFGENGGTGTLAANKTVSVGGAGYTDGYLKFENFTQLSPTSQSLTITGNSVFYNENSIWNGDVTFIGPRHFTRYTTYNSTAFLEKTDALNDNSTGGNIFNDDVIFTNSGTGYFMPSSSVGNDFNADATYIKINSGSIYPTYNCTSTYAGDIYFQASTTIRAGASTNGRVLFDGNSAQSINVIGATPTPEIRDIETQNAIDEITLNTPVIVLSELDLQQGNLITTATNLIYMNDNSIVSNVSDNAYVDGPLEKIGNDAFVFPVGKSGVYRPIEISAPTSGAARFRGEFFANNVVNDGIPDLPIEPTIDHVSDCEYWILDRIASTNSVYVTLSYKNYAVNNCSGVTLPSDIVVARWDGTIWRDHGNGGTTGTAADGTVISSAPVTNFSPFTLADLTGINPLPIELTNFTATLNQNQVDLHWQTSSEINNDYFTVERSENGIDFIEILTQDGAGNSSEVINYYDVDNKPLYGTSYYRLKQTDFDGEVSYSGVISVNRSFEDKVVIYPNPFTDAVNILISESEFNVEILSADGKMINNYQNTTSIDLSYLVEGVYFIRIYSTNGELLKTDKIIKQ
ncbi:MAG: T9SS type A sorting domain-containing protein [Putridiphycobacter sp.]